MSVSSRHGVERRARPGRMVAGLGAAAGVVCQAVRGWSFPNVSVTFLDTVLFFTTIALCAWVAVELYPGLSSQGRWRGRLLVGGLAAAVVLAEALLRYVGSPHENYCVRNDRAYCSNFVVHEETWQHVHPKNASGVREGHEFAYEIVTNSLGIRDREYGPKRPDELRVVALGDSFTEGVGAAIDDSWPRALERISGANSDRPITVVNGGVSGGDPFFSFVLLRDQLLAMHEPTLVILATNTSDIGDIAIRGGMERFQADGTVRYRFAAPGWEYFYAVSRLVRFPVHELLGYDGRLLGPGLMEAAMGRGERQLLEAVMATASLAAGAGASFLVVLHPFYHQVTEVKPRLGEVRRELERRGVGVLDLGEFFQHLVREGAVTPESIFWPVDQHHNARGYQLFAEAVAARITQAGLLPAH